MNQSDYRKLAKQLQPDKNPEAGSSDSLIISARQGNREKRTFVFNADHDDDENESDFAEDESESDSVSSHLHQCRGADGSCRQPEKRFIIEEYIEQFDQRSAWSRHGY